MCITVYIDFFETATIRSLRTKMQLLHLISWRGTFSDESPKNLQKLSIYAKFPHQEGHQVENLIFLSGG